MKTVLRISRIFRNNVWSREKAWFYTGEIIWFARVISVPTVCCIRLKIYHHHQQLALPEVCSRAAADTDPPPRPAITKLQYKSYLSGHSPPAKLGRTPCWASSLSLCSLWSEDPPHHLPRPAKLNFFKTSASLRLVSSRAVSTSTGISGCFQPGQAKVVLGPTPLLLTLVSVVRISSPPSAVNPRSATQRQRERSNSTVEEASCLSPVLLGRGWRGRGYSSGGVYTWAVKGGRPAPPTLSKLGQNFHHHWTYTRKKPSPVYSKYSLVCGTPPPFLPPPPPPGPLPIKSPILLGNTVYLSRILKLMSSRNSVSNSKLFSSGSQR